MINIYASAVIAKVIQILGLRDSASGAFEANAMDHSYRSVKQDSSIAIRLQDWKDQTASAWKLTKRVIFAPFRKFLPIPNPPNVFVACDQFKMIWTNAGPIPAQMVQLQTLRDRSKFFLPKPNVTEIQPSLAMDSRIAVSPRRPDQPALGKRIFSGVQSLAMAWVIVQPVFAGLMPPAGSLREWRYQSAAAQAQSVWVLYPLDRPLIVVFQIADIASFHQARFAADSRFFSDGDGLAAATKAYPARVWAAGVSGIEDGSATVKDCGSGPGIVALEESLFIRKPRAAAAFAITDGGGSDPGPPRLPSPDLHAGIVSLQKLRLRSQRSIASATTKPDTGSVCSHSRFSFEPVAVLLGSFRLPFSVIGKNRLSFLLSKDNVVLL